MTLIQLILVLIGVFAVGYYTGMRHAAKVIGKMLQNGMKDKTLIPICVAEYQQGNFYLYDKETNKFMCQGKTLDDVARELSIYKKITLAFVFLCEDGKDQSFWIINGKINAVRP